jgi:ABC-type antimicrobial peptide transport system permease subunit
MSIAVRTSVPPLSILPSLRREVRGATGDQVLYQVRTMDQLAASSVARQRWLMLLFGIFAALALVLACVGIYGVLAYLTGRRVAEIGIRMALGAAGRDCIWLVLRQSLAMILSGVVIGLAGALGAAQLLLNLVEGMTPGSAATFAMTVAVLVLAASIASFLPARRAARIDPMAALRL